MVSNGDTLKGHTFIALQIFKYRLIEHTDRSELLLPHVLKKLLPLPQGTHGYLGVRR